MFYSLCAIPCRNRAIIISLPCRNRAVKFASFINRNLSDCLSQSRKVGGILCKGYRPEARGYVIYSPRALPEGAARGQHTRGMNHITTS